MFLQRIGRRGIGLGTLFDRAAARHPENVMILDHDLDLAPHLGRRATVAEIADLVADYAARLRAAGVGIGERVAVYKTNGFDITLFAFAAARIGAVPVLLSPKLDGATAAELVRRIGRPHLVTDQRTIDGDLPEPVLAEARSVLLTSGSREGATALDSLGGAERVPPVALPPGHPALITHTSGTTGLPKLAVHTGLSLQARYYPQYASLAAIAHRREVVAIHVSFVHSRLFTALGISLSRGFPVAVLADSDPAATAGIFARLRPGIIEAHPNSFLQWEELADDPRAPFSNVKLFSSTFDALHPRTVHRLLGASRRRAPLFGQLYGQSEVGPVVVRAFARRHAKEAVGRCVGFAFPGMTRVRVVSRDGHPPSELHPGHIEVHTDGRVATYLGEQERFDRQVDNGWWRMGDVGYKTRWGCLHLLDREVDLIDGFGSTLAAEDVLLSGIEELTEVVVVPGPGGTAVPVVCTRDDAPLDPVAWQNAAAGLPPMADPVHRRFEDLPQTATLKIKRIELAQQLSATGPGSR
ncbi:class I adenylate-forming enzyme family protein [Nocardiopsis coralliicola]